MTDDDIERPLLLACLDDWEPAIKLVALARRVAGEAGYRDAAARVLRSLLERRLVEIGEIGESGFEAYGGSVPELVDRAMEILEATNWLPGLGDFWIATTQLGDEVARELLGPERT